MLVLFIKYLNALLASIFYDVTSLQANNLLYFGVVLARIYVTEIASTGSTSELQSFHIILNFRKKSNLLSNK